MTISSMPSQWLKRIARGIPGHPGTPIILGLFVLGIIAAGALWGGLMMLAFYGPIYLIGAWERGCEMERGREQEPPR